MDWLDGGIARLTNTTSEFGRRTRFPLSDIISFGIAPAILAYTGMQFVGSFPKRASARSIPALGYILRVPLSGMRRRSARQVQHTEESQAQESRPSASQVFCRPADSRSRGHDRRNRVPRLTAIRSPTSYRPSPWLLLLALLSFLMISTWRYWSFKDLNLLRPRTPLILVVMGGVIYGIVYWSQPVLVMLASIYVGSGIAIRIGGIVRRHLRHTPKVNPETQIG